MSDSHAAQRLGICDGGGFRERQPNKAQMPNSSSKLKFITSATTIANTLLSAVFQSASLKIKMSKYGIRI